MPVDQALQELLASTDIPLVTEEAPLAQVRGRVLAGDCLSGLDVPPADNSAMDGYALRYEDLATSDRFPVSQTITAGKVGESLKAGSIARIFTGAELPPGADTVVMQENTQILDDGSVQILEKPEQRGDNVRPRGQDIQQGQVILSKGQRLRAQDLGLLASVGIASVPVYKRLQVAIFSTGDELVDPGATVKPGQIYNSNRYTLLGKLDELGFDVLDLGVVRDDPQATLHALQQASHADVIISSGGVSVGDADHVKGALQQAGELQFWHLAIKPGKPFTFGHVLGKPFMGLPGNPAAVFVTFSLLCRPWLLKAQGASEWQARRLTVTADFTISKPGRRQEYLRARLDQEANGPVVRIYPNQSSGVLYSACWGNGLVELPVDTCVKKGDSVTFIPYDSLG